MPRREDRASPAFIAIALIITFLLGKFLGLWKAFHIDPFGIEPEWVYGVLALAIGILYKENRDLAKEVRDQFQKINTTLSQFGERITRVETISEMKKEQP